MTDLLPQRCEDCGECAPFELDGWAKAEPNRRLGHHCDFGEWMAWTVVPLSEGE